MSSGETKTYDVASDDTMTGDVQSDDTMIGDVLSDDTTTYDVASDDTMIGEVPSDDTMIGDVASDDTMTIALVVHNISIICWHSGDISCSLSLTTSSSPVLLPTHHQLIKFNQSTLAVRNAPISLRYVTSRHVMSRHVTSSPNEG